MEETIILYKLLDDKLKPHGKSTNMWDILLKIHSMDMYMDVRMQTVLN
jgi:hypothetical protein